MDNQIIIVKKSLAHCIYCVTCGGIKLPTLRNEERTTNNLMLAFKSDNACQRSVEREYALNKYLEFCLFIKRISIEQVILRVVRLLREHTTYSSFSYPPPYGMVLMI